MLICHCCNMIIKFELSNDILHIIRKTIYIISEITFNIIRVIKQGLKCVLTDVIEFMTGYFIQQTI